MRWIEGLVAVSLLGCGNERAPQIECGKGTVLKGGKCEAVFVAAPSDAAVVLDAAITVDAGPVTAWKYETKTDAMRGVSSDIATITSKNQVDLGAPYGPARLVVIIRHDPSGASVPGDHVIVGIVPGQLGCHLDGCTISYKIDDHKVERWQGEELSSSRGGAIFLDGDGKWAAKLAGAAHLTIEVPLYGHAQHQFAFDVGGLRSPIPAPQPEKAAAAPAKKEWCYNIEGTPEPVCWPTSEECAVRLANAGNSAVNGCKEW